MDLIFIAIAIIEFIVVLVLLRDRNKIKNKFDINEYEAVILSICKGMLIQLEADIIDINEFCEEVKTIFYDELEKANIMTGSLEDINTIAYIKNLISINNLYSEVNKIKEKEYMEDKVDEIYNIDNVGPSVSMLSAIDEFYK